MEQSSKLTPFEKFVTWIESFGTVWAFRVLGMVAFFVLMAPALIMDIQYLRNGNPDYGVMSYPVLFAVLGLVLWGWGLVKLLDTQKEIRDRKNMRK